MTFKIVFTDETLYRLKKFDNKTAKRVLGRIEPASKNPLHFFERLSGRDEYKLGHRKNIYKR